MHFSVESTYIRIVNAERDALRRLSRAPLRTVRARDVAEAAAAAVATALYGDGVPVLTGLSAARMHRALPRAIGVGYVAVPTPPVRALWCAAGLRSK